jgi:hypothetical protein
MVRRPLRWVLAATFALTGCSALLDVKDIYFDPTAGGGGTEGGADGPTTTEGGGDGGPDSASCVADTQTDPKNCGRCGHSCLGGTCTAGTCQAFEVASVTDAPLSFVAVSDQYVFMSTHVTLTTQAGGLWRVPKGGGPAELYSPIRYSDALVIVGDTLYFVVDDNPNDGTPDQTGGLYSCPVVGAAPCAPKLIAPSTSSHSIVADNGKVFYSDDGAGKGLMVYAPPAAPVVFRDGFGFSSSIFVDGQKSFYVATFFSPLPTRAKVFEILPDAGVNEVYAYDNEHAAAGRIIGDPNALIFTAYDYQVTNGGAVRRIPRTGGAPCNIGGSTNRRPYGVYADANRVYWTNLGDGADEPYTNGSVASCEQTGCCTTPTVMWTGNGQPEGITGDADALYFVTNTKGSLWKVAKP